MEEITRFVKKKITHVITQKKQNKNVFCLFQDKRPNEWNENTHNDLVRENIFFLRIHFRRRRRIDNSSIFFYFDTHANTEP